MRTIKDSLERSRSSGFVGREREIQRLEALLEPTGPIVLLLNGVGGIGKTSLVRAFEQKATAQGRHVRRLDCRAIEPIPGGLLRAIGESLGRPVESIEQAALAIQELGGPVVFALDNYDALRLLDGWLRTELLPALPAAARFVIVGRGLATAPWISAPGWADLVTSLRLGPLAEGDVEAFLDGRGFQAGARARIAHFSKGNPLALQLCTASVVERSDGLGNELELSQVIDHLAHSCVAEIEDAELREAIAVASLVRRVTRPIMEALLGSQAVEGILERFRELSFVEATADGMVLHDSFRFAIESRMIAMDPGRCRKLKLTAWRCLRDQLQRAPQGDTWRYMADLLFLLERPVIREAFFPSGTTLPVERAKSVDREAILEIVLKHDGLEAQTVLSRWWERVSHTFSVVRGTAGEVSGFYVLARPQDVPEGLADEDPVLKVWLAEVRARGANAMRPCLLIRSLLSRRLGERQCAEWAACALDAKRSYLENPTAMSVFSAIREPEEVPAAVWDLGFRFQPELRASVGSCDYHTTALDFGPQGPLDWMLGFVGRDLQQAGGVGSEIELDTGSREVIVRGRQRLSLTRLEFEFLAYVSARRERVVTRDELLREVWQQPFGGSNVVDAVVRGLRKKLGASAWVIGTVKGHGYRYFTVRQKAGPAR